MFCQNCGQPSGGSEWCSNSCCDDFYIQAKLDSNAFYDSEWEAQEPELPEGDTDHDEGDRVAFEMEKVSIKSHRPSEY